jgi:hypothetical protein
VRDGRHDAGLIRVNCAVDPSQFTLQSVRSMGVLACGSDCLCRMVSLAFAVDQAAARGDRAINVPDRAARSLR